MKNAILGFMTAYTILISCFAAGMYKGQIASIQQACVERASVTPVDFVTDLERGRK